MNLRWSSNFPRNLIGAKNWKPINYHLTLHLLRANNVVHPSTSKNHLFWRCTKLQPIKHCQSQHQNYRPSDKIMHALPTLYLDANEGNFSKSLFFLPAVWKCNNISIKKRLFLNTILLSCKRQSMKRKHKYMVLRAERNATETKKNTPHTVSSHKTSLTMSVTDVRFVYPQDELEI